MIRIVYSKNTIIRDEAGLHMRPASELVKKARMYDCSIWIEDTDTGRSANAKSILMLLSLALSGGKNVTISAEGNGAREAVDTLVGILNQN